MSFVFTPERGLREGCSLSAYLFIIVFEGLSSLIHVAEWSGDISGIEIYRRAPTVSHLSFAKDNLLFTKANPESGRVITDILNFYKEASG